MTTVQVAVRLPANLLQGIDKLVPATHSSRSEVIRRAVELYLYRLECERDAEILEQNPFTDEELALSQDSWKVIPPW